jgi:energy coupling factor transporter S component ThiW
MVWFTGQQQNLYWFVYTPRFVGATIIGSVIAYFVLVNLLKINSFKEIQRMFVG